MKDKEQLRKSDFWVSFFILFFGIWIIAEALKMPLTDSYAGVQNAWYVSPALFPLIIGSLLILLAILLFFLALKEGGAKGLLERIQSVPSRINKLLDEKNIRLYAILLAFTSFVYLDIPRIDFFLSILLFLGFFLTSFYFDNVPLLKRFLVFYFIENFILLVLFITPVADILKSLFLYSMDVIALIMFVAYMVYVRKSISNDQELRQKYRQVMLISWLVPLIIVPIFRYALLVQFPVEGGIVGIMHLVYYSIW
ncbi:hypothetical protein WKV44_03830 [Spirochaetia bacterium 38H-sp]|uniref:Uncharacterized protein n=1 Tax=Rarispira pelagica TaxID=3141764 RepID=A0ABU9UAG9_9SPIR